MKISFSHKEIEKTQKGVTPVFFEEGDKTRFVEKNGRDELYIGVGKKSEITQRKFILLCRKIIQTAKQYKLDKIAIPLDQMRFPQLKKIHKLSGENFVTLMGENFVMANFEFTTFRTKPKDGWPEVKEVVICGNTDKKIEVAAKKGQTIGEYVNRCRELSNAPGGDMTPRHLAEDAKKLASGTTATVKVLGTNDLKKLKMGAILGVARGSKEEPKLIIMEYKGGKKSDKPIVLVGKGVTFDTGGINLKPGDASLGMHMDMSGGAAVLSAVALAAKLKIKKNVVAIVPAVENMPSGESYRPGDVLRSMSGKTIEVLNTDAEGRLVLADVMWYAQDRFKPVGMIDLATLTGAIIIALGIPGIAIAILTLALWPILRARLALSRAGFSSVFQTSVRWNGFLAFAVAEKLFPPEGAAMVALVMAIIIIPINVESVAVVAWFTGRNPNLGGVLRKIAVNPLIIATAAAIVVRFLPFGIPVPLMDMLNLVARAALGMGLMAIGAGLRPQDALRPSLAVWVATALKLVIYPALVIGVALLLGLTGPQISYLALCAAVPTAMNGYVLARQMGGDAELYAAIATVQTAVAFLTIPLVLAVAGQLSAG